VGCGAGGSDAVLEAPAFVAGLDDVAVMGKAVKQRGGHFGVADHCRLPLFRIGRWLGLASLILIIRSSADALI
jgi:hypothetical protein